MKKISLLVLIVVVIFLIYQFQRPILTENNAVFKAKEYLKIINEDLNQNYDTEKPADYCVLERDTVWNKIKGNRQWSVMIDGVVVDIKAYNGEFIQMTFPLDGVIDELPN